MIHLRRPYRWFVIRAGREKRWGGEVRRQHLFERFAERTNARVFETWTNMQRNVRRYPWWNVPARIQGRPRLVSSEQPPETVMAWVAERTDPVAVAIYDDAVAQADALGLDVASAVTADAVRRRQLSLTTFRWHVVPTASFARLARLDARHIIVGGNGTNSDAIRPGPWPSVPAIGFVSGAAPGRGIESLIDAGRLVRAGLPELRLYLWLISTSPESELYLNDLRAATSGDEWVEIAHVPYAGLGAALARASVLSIPHPRNAYMDVALPVKLFDSMSAGRPLVVTPRLETAAIIQRYEVGLVTEGDSPYDLATDWRIVGDRIASALLAREGR
jgi:glycosyltransferase involved in cell wall biosynthesis